MLTSEKEVEQKVRGLRAGADDYLVKPFHQAELLARMRGLLSRFTATDGGAVGRPPLGKMIAFYGAKGGVGATTIAINTAIALHDELDRKVALVDAVLQFGDHRVFLDLGNDRKSVTDLVDRAAARRRAAEVGARQARLGGRPAAGADAARGGRPRHARATSPASWRCSGRCTTT